MHQKPFACKNSPQKTVLILLWPVVDFWGRRIPEATTHGPQMSWLRDSPLFCWLQGCLCFDGWLIIYMLSTEYIHCTGVIFPVSFPMQCIGLAVHDTAASPSNSSRPRLSEGILSGWGGVEALSAHKLPSAATVWWCRACVAVSNPKNHKDHYVFIWCLGYETGSDLDQFTSPQMIALQGLETLLLLKRRAPLLCQVRTCEVKGETFLESFRMLMDWDLGEGKSRLTTSRKTWQFAASNSVARATPPGSRRSPGGIVEAHGSWGDNKSCSVMMLRTSLDSKNVRVDETISHLIIPDWECFRSDCNCNTLQ